VRSARLDAETGSAAPRTQRDTPPDIDNIRLQDHLLPRLSLWLARSEGSESALMPAHFGREIGDAYE
jgi:hypothetical protein